MEPQKLHPEYAFRLADIEVEQSQLDDKIVGVFRFESNGQSKKGPVLLVLAEVNGTGYVYDQLIDVVNNEAEQSRTLTIGVDTDPVTRFEKIVQNVNNAVAKFVEQEPTPINWTRVNMFLVELSNGHVCLTGVGRLMNMFLQKQPDGTFKTFDLFGSLEQKPDVDPNKLFASIICGDMKNGDTLLMGSQNLERLRNELRMKERLTTLPPVTAALEISQDLERQSIPDDFVATIAACLPAEAAKAMAAEEPGQGKSTASIQKMRSTEDEAARQLGPLIGPRPGGAGRADTAKGEPLAPIIGGTLGLLSRLRRIVTREKARDVAALASLRGMNAGFGTFLTKKRKSLLTAAVILVVVIFVAGSLIKFQQNAAAERAAWNATFDQAKGLIERADGESVYSEDKARRTLAEADEMLAGLDDHTKDRTEAIAGLRATSDGLREKLRRILSVAQPAQLYALPDGTEGDALTSPVFFKNRLVMLDRSGPALVSLDPATKDAKRVELPDSVGTVTAIAPGRESVIVASEDGSVFATNLDNGTTAPLTIGDGSAQAMTDVTTYANRLYRLDAPKSQIWRYPSATGGFGAEQAYLQATNTDLSDAVALAIDSNIYVLKHNGVVARFFSGGEDGFSLPPIDPALENGDDIWADADGQYVAIADKIGKRIVLFTKEGRLVAQYTSPAFQGPVGIMLNETDKKLFVTDGNNLYELALP